MTDGQRAAKNISVTGFSNLLNSVFGFILIIYIARSLGENDFGIYNFALSFTALFAILADPGISSFMVREIARNKNLTDEYVTNVSLIKLLLSVIAFLLIVLVINALDYPNDTKMIVYIFGLYRVFITFSLTYKSIFQAFEKMELNAIVEISKQIILILLASFVIYSGYGLLELAYVYVFVGILDITLSHFILRSKIKYINSKINISLCKTIVLKSLPFGFNGLFAVIFFKIDVVMLSYFQNDFAVGIYSAAYVPLLALATMLSYTVTSAIYPLMSRYHVGSPNSLYRVVSLSLKFALIIGIPVFIGCVFLSEQIIHLFYNNQYSESMIVFALLALFVPFRLVNGITGTLLTSINQQYSRTSAVALSATINILLNAILIPYMSYMGAAIATVISEFSLFLIFSHLCNYHNQNISIKSKSIRPIIASLIMGLFIVIFSNMNVFLSIILSIIIYFIVLVLLGTFTQDDKNTLKRFLQRK